MYMVRKCNNDIPQTYYHDETQNADKDMTAIKVSDQFSLPQNDYSCTPDGYLRFYPGIENRILPRLSYPDCHVRAICIGCIGAHTHGSQVASLLCLSDVIKCNCILAYSGTGSLF